MKNKINIVSMLIFLVILISTSAVGQQNKINWFSFNMGYGHVQSNNLKIHSVVGQRFVGTVMRNDFQVIGGFLADTMFGGTLVSVNDGKELPKIFSLHQNYPNPFNPSTRIQFTVPKESHVTLKIYDILGMEVETLVDGIVQPGYHEALYVGTRLSSGVYFYRLVAADYTSTKKLVLMK